MICDCSAAALWYSGPVSHFTNCHASSLCFDRLSMLYSPPPMNDARTFAFGSGATSYVNFAGPN
jgi:hypothetical protein